MAVTPREIFRRAFLRDSTARSYCMFVETHRNCKSKFRVMLASCSRSPGTSVWHISSRSSHNNSCKVVQLPERNELPLDGRVGFMNERRLCARPPQRDSDAPLHHHVRLAEFVHGHEQEAKRERKEWNLSQRQLDTLNWIHGSFSGAVEVNNWGGGGCLPGRRNVTIPPCLLAPRTGQAAGGEKPAARVRRLPRRLTRTSPLERLAPASPRLPCPGAAKRLRSVERSCLEAAAA